MPSRSCCEFGEVLAAVAPPADPTLPNSQLNRHRHGALACFDFATAAGHTPVDMNPMVTSAETGVNPYVYKDAVFISTHKLLGGVGGPGVLVAKKSLFSNAVPAAGVGGGTVFYVTEDHHR